MGGRGLAIRIVGLASTTRGFAFAITEGPERLIDWGGYKISSQERLIEALDIVIKHARPLFVACEVARNSVKSERAKKFNEALKVVCARYGIMILCVERRFIERQGRMAEATNYDIATTITARFSAIAGKLPRRPRLWDGANERLGVFLAAAAAAAGWNHFRPRG